MEVLDIIEVPSQSNLEFAPLWKRLAAVIIDLIILVIGYYLFLVVSILVVIRGWKNERWLQQMSEEQDFDFWLGFIGISLGLILSFLYFAILESSWKQGSLGKILFGIRVGKTNGEKISFINSSGRYLAKALSVGILLIGCIMAAFDPHRRALHDRMATTFVFRR